MGGESVRHPTRDHFMNDASKYGSHRNGSDVCGVIDLAACFWDRGDHTVFFTVRYVFGEEAEFYESHEKFDESGGFAYNRFFLIFRQEPIYRDI